MSSLDHNLVCANSLTGIGSVEEALDVLVPGRKGRMTLFDQPVEDALENARTVLVDASLLAESTKEESRAASRASRKALKEAETAKLLFDAAVLTRIGRGDLVAAATPSAIAKMASSEYVQNELLALKPAHMPSLFPEVFLRENAGFDVLVGNPPWKEVMVEEPKFWLRVQPGLLGMDAGDLKKAIASLRKSRAELIPELEKEIEAASYLRKCLLAGPYPGLGTGDVDLYRVFAWRNWQLLRNGGSIGQVFPWTLLTGAGSDKWRQEVFGRAQVRVQTLSNTKGWVFPAVTHQYTIALLQLLKVENSPETIEIAGPFKTRDELEIADLNSVILQISLLQQAGSSLSIPQISDSLSAEAFSRLRMSPRIDKNLGTASFRPVTEFHATNDRHFFDSGGQSLSRWPVLGGSGFNLYEPETGDVYAWAEPTHALAALQERRLRQVKLKSSAFYGLGLAENWAVDKSTLPANFPRIVFRDIARATDPRSCIACLLPGKTFLTNKAPYLLRTGGGPEDEAFLLGVLCSIPLDWYLRKFLELGFNFHLFNSLPIPHVPDDDMRRRKLIENSGRMAAVNDRYVDWAKEVGVKVGSVKTESEKDSLIAENDALVGHMYGLTRAQIEQVLKTFHRGWDYAPRLEKVLSFYDKLPKVKS
jgi:hypothetical protein